MQDFEDDGSAAQGKTGTAEATDGAASAAAPSAGGKSPAPASDVGATVSAGEFYAFCFRLSILHDYNLHQKYDKATC